MKKLNTSLNEYKDISEEEVLQAVRTVKTSTNPLERDKAMTLLLKKYEGMLENAKHMYDTLLNYSDVTDLESELLMGFLRAIEDFDENKNIKFSTFLHFKFRSVAIYIHRKKYATNGVSVANYGTLNEFNLEGFEIDTDYYEKDPNKFDTDDWIKYVSSLYKLIKYNNDIKDLLFVVLKDMDLLPELTFELNKFISYKDLKMYLFNSVEPLSDNLKIDGFSINYLSSLLDIVEDQESKQYLTKWSLTKIGAFIYKLMKKLKLPYGLILDFIADKFKIYFSDSLLDKSKLNLKLIVPLLKFNILENKRNYNLIEQLRIHARALQKNTDFFELKS